MGAPRVRLHAVLARLPDREAALEAARDNWPRLALTAVLVVVFFGNGGFRSLVSNYLEMRRLNHELADLRRQEQAESSRLATLKSGDASLERLARRELGFIKKGEIEYRFPPPTASK